MNRLLKLMQYLENLKTYLQTIHLCKFCTQAFNPSIDFFKHIREVHKEYKCAICCRRLGSHCDLRNLIKGVHGVTLPAKIVLIDFVRKNTWQSDDGGHKNRQTGWIDTGTD
uniref:C2H2-type domain-containing protein n=1 Tax=Glossina palpalis gambiensis TaxID=67801 RepID=A0A1B0C2X9_9MUSC